MPGAPTEDLFPELTAQLEARILRRLAHEWEDINWQLFRSELRPVQLRVLSGQSQLGQWSPSQRVIGLSSQATLGIPWIHTVEVLKHEMAHQYVDEILGGESTPHGPLFVKTCRMRGIDPAATHAFAPKNDEAPEDRIITRVRKLLALAESSNQHEAELAASTAQRLILKFNIDVRQRDNHGEDQCNYVHVGIPTGRVQAHQRRLAALLIEHFFVRGIWVPTYVPQLDKVGSVLELCGRPENLQMAQFVHDFLSRTVSRLWTEHKRTQGIRSDRDRRAFLNGAIAGFSAKLRETAATSQQEGLVWVRDGKTDSYFRRRHPRTRSVRTGSAGRTQAFADGKSAGRTIVLSRPMTSSEGASTPRRALPASRS